MHIKLRKRILKQTQSKHTSYKSLKDYIKKLFDDWYIVHWYEFFIIKERSTQPFMEHSIYRNTWYSQEEIFEKASELKQIIIKNNFKEDEVFFSVLYSVISPLWIITNVIWTWNIKNQVIRFINRWEIIKWLMVIDDNNWKRIYTNVFKCNISSIDKVDQIDTFISEVNKLSVNNKGDLFIWIVSENCSC